MHPKERDSNSEMKGEMIDGDLPDRIRDSCSCLFFFFLRESCLPYFRPGTPLISASAFLPAFSFMDLDKSSPENSPPDHHHTPTMATMVANGSAPNMPGPVGPAGKRYRPAPAKTFQCRGYGDCRMVFSRSEHLARHIRFVSYLV